MPTSHEERAVWADAEYERFLNEPADVLPNQDGDDDEIEEEPIDEPSKVVYVQNGPDDFDQELV